MKRISKLAIEIGFIVIMAIILKNVFPFVMGIVLNVIASLGR